MHAKTDSMLTRDEFMNLNKVYLLTSTSGPFFASSEKLNSLELLVSYSH